MDFFIYDNPTVILIVMFGDLFNRVDSKPFRVFWEGVSRLGLRTGFCRVFFGGST